MKKFIFPFIILCIVVVFSRCKKDEIPPDYAGDWYIYFQEMDTIQGTPVLLNIKKIYKLSKGSFTETYQFQYDDGNYYSNYEFKGTVKTNEDMMSFQINELGIANINGATGLPSGMSYYKEGESIFISYFPNLQARSYSVIFSVDKENGAMYQYSDDNRDGDYADEGETIEYLKQK